MKKLIILIFLIPLLAFSQQSGRFRILQVTEKATGQVALTDSSFVILSQLADSVGTQFDSVIFDTSDGFLRFYLDGVIADSTTLDGRYKLISDSTAGTGYVTHNALNDSLANLSDYETDPIYAADSSTIAYLDQFNTFAELQIFQQSGEILDGSDTAINANAVYDALTDGTFDPTFDSVTTNILSADTIYLNGVLIDTTSGSSVVFGSGTENYFARFTKDSTITDGIIRQNDGGIGDTSSFVALGQISRAWAGMASAPNGNVYASVENGDIYMQTSGIGDFIALSQTQRVWTGMTATSDTNVYAADYGGDIYMQTSGTGNFIALSQTLRNWRTMTTTPDGNVYAAVDNGDIYMQTSGTGNFIALGQTSRDWFGMASAPNGNVYASVKNGDIYMQTSGIGDFIALGQVLRSWYGMTATSNGNIFANLSTGVDIYMQTGGIGSFISLGLAGVNGWSGMTTSITDNIYSATSGGDIYKKTSATGSTNNSISVIGDILPGLDSVFSIGNDTLRFLNLEVITINGDTARIGHMEVDSILINGSLGLAGTVDDGQLARGTAFGTLQNSIIHDNGNVIDISGSLTLLNGDTITEFSNDTTFISNSNDKVPTEHAVAGFLSQQFRTTYAVDSLRTGVDTLRLDTHRNAMMVLGAGTNSIFIEGLSDLTEGYVGGIYVIQPVGGGETFVITNGNKKVLNGDATYVISTASKITGIFWWFINGELLITYSLFD